MQFRGRSILTLLIALLLTLTCMAGAQSGTDEQQLRDLLDNYMKAVDTLNPDLISSIWSHSPEASFIHPRGTAVGFEQIRDDFYKDTMGLFSKRELILEKPVLHIYGDSAWSEMTWTFHATFQNGPQITTTGRETQIYHKEDGAWHIVHVHYSGPPDTRPLKGF